MYRTLDARRSTLDARGPTARQPADIRQQSDTPENITENLLIILNLPPRKHPK